MLNFGDYNTADFKDFLDVVERRESDCFQSQKPSFNLRYLTQMKKQVYERSFIIEIDSDIKDYL